MILHNDLAPVRVSIVYHSSYGHTARQAAAVTAGAASVPGVEVGSYSLTTLNDDLWDALAASDAIIFGSPTYMGSQSSVFQTFAEATSRIWANQGWKDKLAAGFTNSSGVNGDKLNTLTSFAVLAAQHGMHWVNLGLLPGWLANSTGSPDDLNRLGGFLGALAQSPSDAPPEAAPSDADLRTASHLGRRVAELAVQISLGRRALTPAMAAD